MLSHRITAAVQRGATIALGTAIVAVAFTGTATAYWRVSGGGSTTVATGTVSLTATVSPVAGLYPGGNVPVTITVKNTSAAAGMKLTSISQAGAATVQTAGKGTCNASVVSFTSGTLPTTTIAPNTTVAAPGSVAMSSTAADGCQGTTFAIPLIANGRTS
ncbi:MAG TPA: hypothetical protein VHB18_17385 [Mycobacteriales bacterium]|nr:hypothetical protein [Mycobacteriales bacterium]